MATFAGTLEAARSSPRRWPPTSRPRPSSRGCHHTSPRVHRMGRRCEESRDPGAAGDPDGGAAAGVGREPV